MEKKKILVVEDDAFLSRVYRVKLEKEGFEVTIANNGTEALAYLDQTPVALVVLDLMLPGVSGFDLIGQINQRSEWKGVPIVVVTNLGQTKDIERGKELGVSDYIVKADTPIGSIVDKVKQFVDPTK